MTREERHGEFIASLDGWRVWGIPPRRLGAYTDGGAALTRSDRTRRKAQRLARRKNRRRS